MICLVRKPAERANFGWFSDGFVGKNVFFATKRERRGPPCTKISKLSVKLIFTILMLGLVKKFKGKAHRWGSVG